MRKIQFKCYGRSQIEEAELHITEDMVIWNGKEYKSHELALDIPTSGNIYGTLLNYKGALAALGNSVHELPYKQAPMAPILYIKPINTMIARECRFRYRVKKGS